MPPLPFRVDAAAAGAARAGLLQWTSWRSAQPTPLERPVGREGAPRRSRGSQPKLLDKFGGHVVRELSASRSIPTHRLDLDRARARAIICLGCPNAWRCAAPPVSQLPDHEQSLGCGSRPAILATFSAIQTVGRRNCDVGAASARTHGSIAGRDLNLRGTFGRTRSMSIPIVDSGDTVACRGMAYPMAYPSLDPSSTGAAELLSFPWPLSSRRLISVMASRTKRSSPSKTARP